MAQLDFGLLTQAPTIGSRFIEGQQAAQQQVEQNRLRQMQMMQMEAQRENLLAQREQRTQQAAQLQAELADRAARARRQQEDDQWLGKVAELFANNKTPLTLQTAQEGLSFAIRSRDKNAIEMMTKTVQALQDRADFEAARAELFPTGGAAPAAPGQAPAPGAAPANAMSAGRPTPEMISNMLMSSNPRVREMGKGLVQLVPKETAPSEVSRLQAEIDALPPGSPLRAKLEARQNQLITRPEPARLSVNLPPQEKAFETELGKSQAESLIKSRASAEEATQIIDTVNTGRQIMKSGMLTGAGAEFLVKLNQALKTAGIDAGYADASSNSQAFAANMAANVGRVIKQFGAGTGLSNADRDYAEKMAGGKINLDEKAINKILDINERMARNVIKSHNSKVKGVKSNIPLQVDEPIAPAPAGSQASQIPSGAPAASGGTWRIVR